MFLLTFMKDVVAKYTYNKDIIREINQCTALQISNVVVSDIITIADSLLIPDLNELTKEDIVNVPCSTCFSSFKPN